MDKRLEPIGISPRFIHQEHRLQEIEEAISKRLETLHTIPTAWVEERNDIVNYLKTRRG